MKTVQTLIRILIFFNVSSVSAQTETHSLKDLYNQTVRIYSLSSNGKSLSVIGSSDSLIHAYRGFPGAEKYLGFLYIYMAEAAKQQGDISLARTSYELASGFFQPGSEISNYQIPVNLISLDLDAGRFEHCIKQGLFLMDSEVFKKDPAKRGTLLNNLAAAAIGSGNLALADSLFSILFSLIDSHITGAGFDIALTYRNFGRYKLITGFPEIARKVIRKSLDLYRMQYGDVNFQTAKSWHALGNVFKRLNDPDSANYCYILAKKALQSSNATGETDNLTPKGLDYATLDLELLVDEVDLQIKIAMQHRGSFRTTKLMPASETVAGAIKRFESIQQGLICSESGFILADKLRAVFERGILVNIDLYKETGYESFLRQAFMWSLQSVSISLTAKAGLEELMECDDSMKFRTMHLYRIRENLGKAIDRDYKSKLLQEYLSVKKQLATIGLLAELFNEPVEKQFDRINNAIGKRPFLCYHQMDSLLLVYHLSQSRIGLTEIPITDQLSQRMKEFKNLLVNPRQGNYYNTDVQNLTRTGIYLYQVLLKPFVSGVSPGDLFVHCDGLMDDLPLEALITDCTSNSVAKTNQEFRDLPFVIKNFQVSYVFGVKPVKQVKTSLWHRKSLRILFCPNDSLAPEISNEADYLTSIRWQKSLVDIGDAKFDVRTMLAKADVIHFAGHILLNQDDAERTTLGCSDQTKGAFQLSELLHITIESDLVFINGCESAQGILNRGDGNLSPGLFFLLAGAGGVIEHWWKAPDASASFLAREFYRNFGGFKSANALSKSKRKYLASCQPGLDHPHYWAGMIYSGPLVLNGSFNKAILLFIPVVILLIAATGLAMYKKRSHNPGKTTP